METYQPSGDTSMKQVIPILPVPSKKSDYKLPSKMEIDLSVKIVTDKITRAQRNELHRLCQMRLQPFLILQFYFSRLILILRFLQAPPHKVCIQYLPVRKGAHTVAIWQSLQ